MVSGERSEMLKIAVVDCCKIQKQQNIKIILHVAFNNGYRSIEY